MNTGRAIDHVGIAARDLDGLAARYQALGFTLTPRAHHPDHMGTSNRLVQFKGRNFLELIEVDRPEGVTPLSDSVMSFGAYTAKLLERREGINLIVFRTDDRDATREDGLEVDRARLAVRDREAIDPLLGRPGAAERLDE